jgi:hypothetical protein
MTLNTSVERREWFRFFVVCSIETKFMEQYKIIFRVPCLHEKCFVFCMKAVKALKPEISLNNIELHHHCIYLQIKNLYRLLSFISADAVVSEYFRH